MTEESYRKAQPNCLLVFIRHLRLSKTAIGQGTANVEQLAQNLANSTGYSKSIAVDNIHNAIQDGLLVPVTSSGGVASRSRSHECQYVRLPELNEVKVSDHDFYCFECHLPGTVEFCKQCHRSFHRLCYRRKPERPNYIVPSDKMQKNRLPDFNTDNNGSTDNDERASTIADYESDVFASPVVVQALDQSVSADFMAQHIEDGTVDSSISPIAMEIIPSGSEIADVVEGKPLLVGDYNTLLSDNKTKMDVVCMGEVRPPTRRRPAMSALASDVSYKSEVSANEEGGLERELCTCCRLLASAAMHNPPNLESDELCHLLNQTFLRNKSWVAHDVAAYSETHKLLQSESTLLTKLLFKVPPQRLDDIEKKISENLYVYLMEFLVDILDLQHSIGVFFGFCSVEMEATKWLVRDITHDLAEIQRCPDCFRYSHEKHSRLWFAKPCVQRHELVFAKCSGFPYWPAKVMRVLHNNKYDVRFFGGDHSRALLDVKFIRSIDHEGMQAKLASSQSFKNAMEELRYHQILSTYPPSKFAFHANKNETNDIMRTAFGIDVDNERGGSVPNKRRKRDAPTANFNCVSLNEMEFTAHGRRHKRDAPKTSKGPRPNTRSSNPHFQLVAIKKMQNELNRSLKMLETSEGKTEKLLEKIQKLKNIIKSNEIEKKLIKRKQWCFWCLNEAIYLCCFRAAYCSEICQLRHWKYGHSKVCKNDAHPKLQAEATSTS